MNGFKLYLPGRLLCRISPRFHLWAICRAIGIKPYVWQRAFALGRINSLPGKRTPGNGKTTAVMLRLLMLPRGPQRRVAEKILDADPNWPLGCDLDRPLGFNRKFKLWYAHEYHKLQLYCHLARVPVSDLEKTLFKPYIL